MFESNKFRYVLSQVLVPKIISNLKSGIIILVQITVSHSFTLSLGPDKALVRVWARRASIPWLTGYEPVTLPS